jgi:hypothetical protein
VLGLARDARLADATAGMSIGAGSIVPGEPTDEDLKWAEQALAD